MVKWHGKTSEKRYVPGGGPQGAYLGNLQYKAQSNESANCVKEDSRFQFVDDLTVLEKINLLLVGIASHNNKGSVPNDIDVSNQIILCEHLKSQKYLDKINDWTSQQKIILNEDKTKSMVFNFTKKKQFTTRLKLNIKTLETVKRNATAWHNCHKYLKIGQKHQVPS